VLAAGVWSFGVTYLIAFGLKRLMPLRATVEDEIEGLDSSQHSERAYEFGSATGMGRFGS
jgi:Amt family ammonium transporter